MSKLLQLKERAEEELLRLEKVAGVGVRNEKIVVYLEEPDEKLIASLPTKIEDVPVMVRVVGKVQALASIHPYSTQALWAKRTEKWRPAPGGVSCGDPTVTAGTLGMWTRDFKLLTNAHVIAINYRTGGFNSPGTEVLQPGPYDGGKLEDKVAYLENYSLAPGVNYVDAAVATPVDGKVVNPDILEAGIPLFWCEAKQNMYVEKSGRTSGLTRSRVIDANATIKVHGYPFGTAVFKDQILFENFGWSAIKPGDSGSVLVTRVAGVPAVVGLCFAGSPVIGVANKASRVIEALKVDLGAKVEVTPPAGYEAVGAAIVPAIPLSVIAAEQLKVV